MRAFSFAPLLVGLALPWSVQAAPGGMSKADFQTTARTRMLRADGDKDGRISKTEWAEGRKEGRRDPGRMFDRLDANADGFLDAAEIDVLAARRFARLDKNGDGMVSTEERQAARKNLGRDSPTD